MDVPFRSHMSIDFLIFVELIVFTGVISFKQLNSGLLLGIIWAAYLNAVILKLMFYVTLHPWADIVKSDIKSWKWKKSLDKPKIEFVKGPRKSKCMAFYDRVVEGTTFEWTICNNGRAEPEEAKGNSFYVK